MSLGDAIEHYLRSSKMYMRYKNQDVIAAWPEVMGPAIAKHTVDVQIVQGTLLVKLNSAVLRKELDMGKDKIVRMLNEKVEMQVINTLKFL